MFQTMEQNSRLDLPKRLLILLVSVTAHALAVLILVLLPLVFLGVMPSGELLTILIAAPEPPPPPVPPLPPQPRHQNLPPRSYDAPFSEPGSIPNTIPPPDDEEPMVNLTLGTLSAYSGLRGGIVGMGPAGLRILPGMEVRPLAPPPPPMPPPRREPLPVGGKVQEAKLISKVLPIYPDLAIRARVSGEVVLQVRVDEEGNVYDIKVLKGHPLLNEAAMTAVRRWKYSPTFLNGEPVPVVAAVTVIFSLR